MKRNMVKKQQKSIFYKQLKKYAFPDGMWIEQELESPQEIFNYQVILNPHTKINVKINDLNETSLSQKNRISRVFDLVITHYDITSVDTQIINSWIYHSVLSKYLNSHSYIETLTAKSIKIGIRKTKTKSDPSWKDILDCFDDWVKFKGKKCSICQKEHGCYTPNALFDKDFVICSDAHCLNTFQYMFFLPDFISNIRDQIKYKLVVELLDKALKSNRLNKIYYPRPNFIPDTATSNDIPNILHIGDCDRKSFISICNSICNSSNEISDREFYERYPLVYMTLKFGLINFGKMYFTNSNIIDKEKNNIEELFEVKYEIDSPVKFEDDVNDYLFHGSPVQNWYSILSNGLIIPDSDNKLMLNANAYGKGIYLSDSANYSIGYSQRQVRNSQGKYDNSSNLIVGVFQVAKPKKTYKKTSSIYVIKNKNEVKLRYLFIIKSRSASKLGPILQMFNKHIKTSLTSQKKINKKVGNKRLIKEFAKLQKMGANPDSQSGVVFKCQLKVEDQLNVWNISFNKENIPEGNMLYKQMMNKRIDNIEMELTFSSKYPIEPPFVRIVYPRFKYRTGHITLGGSICMDILTNQGWSPIINVEKLMLQIKMLLIDGDAELDSTRWNKHYTMQEAKQAFKRMVLTHGW